jgi:hypothetical protein
MENNNTLAPIVIFAFNRPDVFQRLLDSLRLSPEFKDSDVYVFIDGARKGKTGETEKVKKVQEIAYELKGTANGNPSADKIFINASDTNQGLAKSIISGVSQVISRHGKAIVLEDDLYLAPNCLHFMNEGLSKYKDDKSIFSICGYTNKARIPSNYNYDTYIASRSSSWGWATWEDRWKSVDWNLEDWKKVKSNKSAFNKWGGSDCFNMLNKWHDGKISSWAIRFCYAQFVQHSWSIFPVRSLIKNDGFDGTGTNMRRYSRFKYEFDETNKRNFNWCPSNCFNQTIQKSILYYASIPLRIWSKIMYFVKG